VGYRLSGHAPLDVGMLRMLLGKAKREEQVWADGSHNMVLTVCVTCSNIFVFRRYILCLIVFMRSAIRATQT